MPVVKVEYEKDKVGEDDIQKLVNALQKITKEATGYDEEENSIFASANQVTANASPVEIYISATFEDSSSEDLENMVNKAAEEVIKFKKENNIDVPMNVSIVKMNWKFKIGV